MSRLYEGDVPEAPADEVVVQTTPSLWSKAFAKYALDRAVKTLAQTVAGVLVAQSLADIDFEASALAVATAVVLSVATSVVAANGTDVNAK